MSVPHTSGPKSRARRSLADVSGCTTALPVVLILGFLWIIIIEYFGLRDKGPVWPKVMFSKGRTRVEVEITSGSASMPIQEDSWSSLGPTPRDIGEWNAQNDLSTAAAAHVVPQPALTTVEVWNKGVLTPERRPRKRPLPPVVEAFRKGTVDWHDLIPKHSSIWERFGESGDNNFNFMKLVMKEEKVTDFLTQYAESGLAQIYGTDHGTLLNYSSCNILGDVCTVHSSRTCAVDSFCAWDGSRCRSKLEDIATERRDCSKHRIPQFVNEHGALQPIKNSSACRQFVHEKAMTISVGEEPAAMFYHWWRYFRGLYFSTRGKYSGKKVHFLILSSTNTQFFHYFGLLSNSCWRRAKTQVPPGTCFCEVEPGKSGRDRASATDSVVMEHILNELGLADQPEPSRIRVGIISRRRKRFLLNEDELVDACLDLGLEVQILPLEQMTLFEQLAALRAVTILVGIHGSGRLCGYFRIQGEVTGLNNAIFMRRGTILVQLLPYKLNYQGAFMNNARSAGVEYLEWKLRDRSRARFHWEFLGERELANGRDAYLAKGSPSGGQEVYTFWINQDIIVPLDEFKDLIIHAVRKSPFNSNLAASMNWNPGSA